jgi:hypothetical protein
MREEVDAATIECFRKEATQRPGMPQIISGDRPNRRGCTVYKLIVIIAAAMPTILLLRAIFAGRSQKTSRAFAEFKKQIDYLVWAILFVIGCVFAYSSQA